MLYYETCVAFVDDMNFYTYIFFIFVLLSKITITFLVALTLLASSLNLAIFSIASDNTDRANCLRQAGNSVFRGDVREETICILFVNQTLVSA